MAAHCLPSSLLSADTEMPRVLAMQVTVFEAHLSFGYRAKCFFAQSCTFLAIFACRWKRASNPSFAMRSMPGVLSLVAP